MQTFQLIEDPAAARFDAPMALFNAFHKLMRRIAGGMRAKAIPKALGRFGQLELIILDGQNVVCTAILNGLLNVALRTHGVASRPSEAMKTSCAQKNNTFRQTEIPSSIPNHGPSPLLHAITPACSAEWHTSRTIDGILRVSTLGEAGQQCIVIGRKGKDEENG